MSQLGPAQAIALASNAGFTIQQSRIMAAIAGAESGYVSDVLGDLDKTSAKWGPSIGLWQIRSLHAQSGTGKERDASRLTDPHFNAQSAYIIYGQQGYSAWSTYNSGEYGEFLDAVDATGLATGPSAVDIARGKFFDSPVGQVGSAAVDAGAGVLSGLDAIGAFFAKLGEHGTWVRIAQVVGGTVLVVAGIVWLGKGATNEIIGAAADVLPVGKAAKLAASVAK